MKTFDFCYKDNNSGGRPNNLESYLLKGFQTSASQINQKLRRDLVNDGVIKKHPGKENNSGLHRESTIDSKVSNPKALNKAADYFKTFYSKPTKQVKN